MQRQKRPRFLHQLTHRADGPPPEPKEIPDGFQQSSFGATRARELLSRATTNKGWVSGLKYFMDLEVERRVKKAASPGEKTEWEDTKSLYRGIFLNEARTADAITAGKDLEEMGASIQDREEEGKPVEKSKTIADIYRSARSLVLSLPLSKAEGVEGSIFGPNESEQLLTTSVQQRGKAPALLHYMKCEIDQRAHSAGPGEQRDGWEQTIRLLDHLESEKDRGEEYIAKGWDVKDMRSLIDGYKLGDSPVDKYETLLIVYLDARKRLFPDAPVPKPG